MTEQPHASLLQWHKDLIRLRHEWSELSDGNLNAVEVRFDEQAQWLMLERGSLRIACNLGQAALDMEVGNGAQLLLASDGSIALRDAVIRLGPDSVAVLSVRPPSMNGGARNAPSVAIGATQEHSA